MHANCFQNSCVVTRRAWNSLSTLDFAEKASRDVVDETPDGHFLRNPRMRPEFLKLVPDILFDVLEGVEKSGNNHCGSRPALNGGSQLFLGGLLQSAIRVINDHDFFGAQQI